MTSAATPARYRTLSPSALVVEATPAYIAGKDGPSPSSLHAQAEGSADKYRVLMFEQGYLLPTPPWERAESDKRVRQCGLIHEFTWSPWFLYWHAGRKFVARWCQTCATNEAWEVVDADE